MRRQGWGDEGIDPYARGYHFRIMGAYVRPEPIQKAY